MLHLSWTSEVGSGVEGPVPWSPPHAYSAALYPEALCQVFILDHLERRPRRKVWQPGCHRDEPPAVGLLILNSTEDDQD